MKISLYVMTHREFPMPEDKLYIPLQVGSVYGKDLGYLRDDQGDQISYKNKSYCEMTGVYWLWKNEHASDVVGICHYRRYFFHREHFITETEIEKLLQEYDVIVPNSAMTREGSVLNHYKIRHCLDDLLTCRDVLLETCPDYDAAFRLVMQSNLFTVGNMIITRKEILDSYCNWLFPILFEVEKRIELDGREEYQKRVFGFLSERLLRVWLMNQKFHIREEQVFRVDERFLIQQGISDI